MRRRDGYGPAWADSRTGGTRPAIAWGSDDALPEHNAVTNQP